MWLFAKLLLTLVIIIIIIIIINECYQSSDEVTNRFTALEYTPDELTPDIWQGTKTVLLEVARETIGCVKSQKKKKWISDETFETIGENREAKGKDKN